jgi:hypothetical protein
MEFLKRLVTLERLMAKLAPLLNTRDGVYVAKVVDTLDPLRYGRVKVLLINDNTLTVWLWKATEAVLMTDDTVLVTYSNDIGYVTSLVYPRLIERLTVPEGTTQPDTVTEQFSSPRMAEPDTADTYF